jgi:galactose-3-O-sulfotransferase
VADGRRRSDDRTAIFLHVGKTAGWTLRQILYRNVPRHEVMRVRPPMDRPRGFLNDDPLRAFAALSEAERARPRLLVSHMIFGIHESVPRDSVYFTMLREPVGRALSQYRHVLRRPEHRLHAQAAAGELPLERYVTGGVALEMDNGQTRAIAGDVETPFGQCTPEMLERAKRNLDEHFAVAGVTERFDEMLVALGHEFGWRNLFYVRANAAPQSQRVPVTEADREMIRAQNSLDCELYRHVVERFDEMVARDSRFAADLRRFERGNRLYRPWGRLSYGAKQAAVRRTRA